MALDKFLNRDVPSFPPRSSRTKKSTSQCGTKTKWFLKRALKSAQYTVRAMQGRRMLFSVKSVRACESSPWGVGGREECSQYPVAVSTLLRWQCFPLALSELQRAESQKVQLILKGGTCTPFTVEHMDIWWIRVVPVLLCSASSDTKGFCWRWSAPNLWGWAKGHFVFLTSGP